MGILSFRQPVIGLSPVGVGTEVELRALKVTSKQSPTKPPRRNVRWYDCGAIGPAPMWPNQNAHSTCGTLSHLYPRHMFLAQLNTVGWCGQKQIGTAQLIVHMHMPIHMSMLMSVHISIQVKTNANRHVYSNAMHMCTHMSMRMSMQMSIPICIRMPIHRLAPIPCLCCVQSSMRPSRHCTSQQSSVDPYLHPRFVSARLWTNDGYSTPTAFVTTAVIPRPPLDTGLPRQRMSVDMSSPVVDVAALASVFLCSQASVSSEPAIGAKLTRALHFHH